MAEKLYKRLQKMNERFEVKLMTMNLISRLIGVHQLHLSNFYPMVQKYLFPHQRQVTKIMVYAAQVSNYFLCFCHTRLYVFFSHLN